MAKTSFKPSRVVKKNLPSLGAWLTNAGKSVGVAAMDVITETLPATAELGASAAEFVQNFKSNISDIKGQKESISSAMDLAYWKDLAKTAKNNTIEDLKSGKLYHSADEIYDEDYGDGFDLDFGDDFDMGDEDYDADFSSEDGTTSIKTRHTQDGDTDINQVNVKVDVGNNSKFVQSMETQTKAAVDLHRESVEATKQSTNAIITELSKSNSAISGLLGTIDSNVSSLTTMVTTVSQGTSVQMKYYEDSMKVFNDILGTLTEIKQSTTQNLMGAGQEQREYQDVMDMFSGNGVLDMSAYASLVKKQFGSAVDRNFALMTVKNILSDKDSLKMAFAHPINNLVTGLVKQVIPAFLRESASEFDNTLRETLVAGLYQVYGLSESDNPILQFLGETFGINNKLKTNIDRSNYKRGKVDWDGQSHKTLNEVIPYYLRKIASAVTGEREVGFDYNTGTFKTVKSMRDEYEEDDRRRMISGFSSVKSDFKEFLNKGGFVFDNTKGKDAAAEAMDRFLVNLVTSGKPIRQRKNENTGEFSFLQDIADIVSSGDTDNDYAKLIASFLDTRQKSSVMEMLGRNIQDARASFSKYKQREEAGEVLTNSMYAKETGTTVDPGFDKITGKVLYNSKSSLIDKDDYGKTSTYYLRNILTLLAKGIKTYPEIGQIDFGKRKGRRSKKGQTTTETKYNPGESILSSLARQEENKTADDANETAAKNGREVEREQLDREIKNGKIRIDKNGSGDGSFANFTAAASQFETARLEEERDKADEDSFFRKMTGINSDKPISKIVNKFSEYLKKPSTVLSDLFKKADDFLFKLVFGGDLGVKGSIFKTSIDFVKKQFATFSLWLNDKILEPLHEKFFGENGLFNQLKQTQFGQAVSDFFGRARTNLFGEKDADGNYTGGFFSEYANAMGSAASSIKESLVGDNPDSVLSNIKSMASNMASSTAALFGYDAEKEAKLKEETGKGLVLRTMDDVWTGFKDRVNSWTDSVLGPADDPDNTRRQIYESFKYDMQGKAPKFAAGATMGALAGLFSGAGPVGGAVIGLSTSIIGESETIKQILFGEMDLNTGKRKGGLISKDIIDLFDDNKAGIKTGAVLGTAANLISGGSLGIMGPLAGAAIGGAVSFASNLDSVQRFLYGYDDKDGNHMDGFYDKLQKAFGGTDFKKLGIDAGIGAGVGVLGSFFLPGGPIVGGLLGAGTAIALQTEKFKTFFFGDLDPETNRRSGGLIGKVTETITGPIKDGLYVAQVQFMGWLEQKVISPLSTAVEPILEEGRRAIERTKEAIGNVVKGVGTAINDIVLKPVADTMEMVFAPVIDTSKKVADMTLKVVGGILTSPIKMLQFLGYGLNRKHMKEGQRDYFDQTIGNAFTFNKDKRKELGLDENATIAERLSSFGKFFGGFFNGDFKDSKYSEAGANYASEFNGKKLSSRQKDKLQKKESKAWRDYQIKNKDKRFTNEDREKFDQENGLYTWWKKGTRAKKGSITGDAVKDMNVKSDSMSVRATSVKLEGKLRDDIAKALTYQGYGSYKGSAGENALDRGEYERIGRMFIANRRATGRDVNIEDANRLIPAYKKYEDEKKERTGTAPKVLTLADKLRERDNAYASMVEAAKKAGKTPISREAFDKKRDERDQQKGIKYIDPTKISKEDISGRKAKGGFIRELGAYILSKGERVIPSGNKGDDEKEKKFFDKLKSSSDEKRAKRKEAQDEELKATQAKGSFETKEKLRKEQAEKEEQRTWREKLSETLSSFKDSAVEHYNNWSSIFGKKGKIALAILALSPIIANILGQLVNFANGFGVFQEIKDHIASAVADIGGIKGVVNRIKKLGGEFKELLFGDESLLTRIGNFLFPKDENGENQYTGRSEVALKIAGVKLPKGIKKITKAITNHNEKIRQQALDYATGKDVDKTWINRYDDVINFGKSIPDKVVEAKNRVLGKVDRQTISKADLDGFDSEGLSKFIDDIAGEGYTIKKDLKGNLQLRKRGSGLISEAGDFVKGKISNSRLAKFLNRTKVKTKVISVDDFDSVGDYLKKVQQIANAKGVDILDDAGDTITYTISKDTTLKRAAQKKLENRAVKEAKALEKIKKTDTFTDKLAEKYQSLSKKYSEKLAKKQEAADFKKRQKQFRADWKASEKDAKRAEKLKLREENANAFQKRIDDFVQQRADKKAEKLATRNSKLQTKLDNLAGKADDITQTNLGKKLFKTKNVEGVLDSTKFGNKTDDYLRALDTLQNTSGVKILSDTTDDAGGRLIKFTSEKTGKITNAVKSVSGKARSMAKTRLENKIAGKGTLESVSGVVKTKLSSITEGKSAANGAMKMLRSAFDAIMGAVDKLVKKFTKGKGAKGFLTKLTGFFDNIVKTLTNGQSLSKFMSKVTAKIGAAASGIGILMGLAGGTKANTANLFFVDEEDVDIKMRAISLLWSELQNLPTWIPAAGQIGTAALIIDVVNEMVAEIMGIDFIREASTLIYGVLSNEEDTAKLTGAQSKFEQKYNEEMDNLYEQYKAKQEAAGAEVLSMDDWRATEGKSLNEYNDEQHKTIGHKVFDKLKGTGTSIKTSALVKDIRSTHMGDIFKRDYWAVSATNEDGSMKSNGQILAETAKNVLMVPLTLVKGAINGVIETFTGIVDTVKTTVKTFGDNTKTAFGSITGGTSVFKPEYWNPPTTDDTTDEGNLSQIAFYLNRFVMFLPGLVFGLGKSIGKTVGSVVDKVKKGATLIKDTTDFSSITSLADVFKGDYWKAPEDPQNPMNAAHRAVFYAGRMLTFIPSAVIGLGKDLGKIFAPIIDPIKNAMGPLISKISGAISFDSDEDNPPEDELGGINRVLYYTAKLLGFVPKVIMKIGSVVGKVVTPVFKGISTIAGSTFTGVEDLMTDPTRVFTRDFWAYDAADVGDAPKEIGTLGMILHIAGKLLSFPIASTLGTVKKVGSIIGPVVSGLVTVLTGTVSGTVNQVKSLWDKGIVSVSDGKIQSGLLGFMNNSTKDEGILGTVGTVLSGIVSVVTFPITGIIGVAGTIRSLIAPIAKGLGMVADGLGDMTNVDPSKTTSLGYFTEVINKTKSDDTTGIGGVLHVIGRVLYFPVFFYKKHIKPVVDSVTGFFKGIGDFAGGVFDDFNKGWESFKKGFKGGLDSVKEFFGFGGDGDGSSTNVTVEKVEPVKSTSIYENGARRRATNGNGLGKVLGGNGDTPDTENGFPYYSQNDPRIKDKPYRMSGGKPTDVIETMGNRGCGPTAMAMVASGVKGGSGNPYSPENMARIAESGNYSTDAGTMPNYFTNVGSQLGMNVTPALATAGNIDALLGSGQPVIVQGASDKPGSPFTSSGHYVVAVGKDGNGNVLVNDPRGKSYSGKYTMNQLTDGSARAWGFSNGGFGGKIIGKIKGGFGKLKKLIGGNGSSWIDVVRAVKAAIAAQKPGYNQSGYITINVSGRSIRVRTDCSGFVSACIDVYGNKSGYVTDSRGFTNKNNNTLKNLGFTPLSWGGWDSLQEGDIIAKDGHVEIFSKNSGGRHLVYNCGSDSSVNNAGETGSSKASYTTVWRAPGQPVDVSLTATSGPTSSSSTSSTSSGSMFTALANEMMKPVQQFLYGTTSDSSSSSSSGSSDYSNANISGSDTAQKVWNFFTSLGYSKAATAGILGNMYAESGVDPTTIQSNGKGPAAGIVQWENWKTKSGRWKSMSDYAASKGKDWTDLRSQLEYIDKELHGLGSTFWNHSGNMSKAGTTGTSFDQWVKSTDVATATRQFEGAFERAGKPHMDRRLSAAQSYYNLYAGGNGSGVIGGNGDMDIPYMETMEAPRYHKTSSDESSIRYTGGYGNSYKSMNQSLSRTEKLSQENAAYDDSNVVTALGTVVSTLQDLLVEMRGTKEGVNKFNDKELVVKNTPVVVNQSNTNIQGGNGSGQTQQKPKETNSSTFIDENNYRMARNIASGGFSLA